MDGSKAGQKSLNSLHQTRSFEQVRHKYLREAEVGIRLNKIDAVLTATQHELLPKI